MPRPDTAEQIFDDIFTDVRNLEKRLQGFETWEPSIGTSRRGAHSYRTTNTTLTSGAFRVVVFDAELWDSDAVYDTTTGTFTVPTAGLYLINSKITFTGFVGTVLLKVQNLTTVAYQDTVTMDANFTNAHLSVMMEFAANDTFNIQAFSASNIPLIGSTTNPYQTFAQVQLISS
jgi:hypothetical protein